MKRAILILMFLITTSIFSADNTFIDQTYRIESLEKQVDNFERINNKLLNSIYWTIGSFSLLVFAFMAVNIIAGIQTKKKELENINKELEGKLEIKFNEKSEAINKYFDKHIVEEKKEIDSKIIAIRSAQESNLSKLKSNLLEYRKDYLEYYNTKEKNGWSVLRNILEIIRIDIEAGFSYRIDESLDSLYEYVKDKEIDIDDANDIQETLSLLKEKFSLRKDQISQNIKLKK